MNDLPEVVRNYIKLFADDTKLYACLDTDDQRNSLKEDLDSVMNWSDRWQLRFNTSKCKHLHFGPETSSEYCYAGVYPYYFMCCVSYVYIINIVNLCDKSSIFELL